MKDIRGLLAELLESNQATKDIALIAQTVQRIANTHRSTLQQAQQLMAIHVELQRLEVKAAAFDLLCDQFGYDQDEWTSAAARRQAAANQPSSEVSDADS